MIGILLFFLNLLHKFYSKTACEAGILPCFSRVSLQVAFARICTFPVDVMLTWICRICICCFFLPTHKRKGEFYDVFLGVSGLSMQLAVFERVPKGHCRLWSCRPWRGLSFLSFKPAGVKKSDGALHSLPFSSLAFHIFFFHGSHKILPLSSPSVSLSLISELVLFRPTFPLLISSLPFNLRGLFPTSVARFQTPPRVIPVCHLLPLQSYAEERFSSLNDALWLNECLMQGLFTVHKGVLLSATLLCTC